MNLVNRRRISRLLSLMLRHRPDAFGLEIDNFGFVPLEQVVQAVKERYEEVEEKDILDLVNAPDQHRFEIAGEKIRALYGHTFFVEMDGEPLDPPPRLYLGTTANEARRFRTEGILPGDRFYVHLSLAREAAEARSREEGGPVVVEVLAQEASQAGIQFYARGEVVLTRQVPAQFVGEIYGLPAAEKDGGQTQEWGWKLPPSAQITYGRKLRKATRK